MVAIAGIVQLAYSALTSTYTVGHLQLQFGVLILALVLHFFAGFRLASIVRWLALLMLPMALLAPVASLLIFPFGMTAARFHVYPAASWLGLIGELGTLALCAFLAWHLGSKEVMDARESAGRKRRNPAIPLIIGAIVSIAAIPVMRMMQQSESGLRAVALAKEKYGPGYNYAVEGINWSSSPKNGNRTTVVLTVWNDKEYGRIPVSWPSED
jgi:hypothetical protein